VTVKSEVSARSAGTTTKRRAHLVAVEVKGPGENDGGSYVQQLEELVRAFTDTAERAPAEPGEANKGGRARPVVLQRKRKGWWSTDGAGWGRG
jgi:hypothetical protein